jgi:hypothetical protein
VADEPLSEAVVLYFGGGTSAWPLRQTDAVQAAFGAPMLERVIALQHEVMAPTPDWSSVEYLEAGRQARERMANAHPELTDVALDALQWEFFYAWK